MSDRRGPDGDVASVGNRYAFIFYKAHLLEAISSWLLDNMDECGLMRMDVQIVTELQDAMNALTLEEAFSKVRAEMCDPCTVRAMIKAVWFMARLRKEGETIGNPMLVVQELVDEKYAGICVNRYDFMMVYRGFNAMGRRIDRTKQPGFDTYVNLPIDCPSDVKTYLIYNPMTIKHIKKAMKEVTGKFKANNEKKGDKRGASLGAHVVSMIHRYETIKRFMLNDAKKKAGRLVSMDSQDRKILQRMLMTYLAMCISLTYPNRCVEYCCFSWLDLKEVVCIDGKYYDVPLINRCMLSTEDRAKLSPVKFYYMAHYCGKTKRVHTIKTMHALPGFASLISLPMVFEFVVRLMLEISPHLILKPMNNPQALMIFQVKQKLTNETDDPVEFLSTSVFGTWLTNTWSVPPGAVPNSWIMPYTSRVTFARVLVNLDLLDPKTPEHIRLTLRHLFGHTDNSDTIEEVYARQLSMTQAFRDVE